MDELKARATAPKTLSVVFPISIFKMEGYENVNKYRKNVECWSRIGNTTLPAVNIFLFSKYRNYRMLRNLRSLPDFADGEYGGCVEFN